MIHDIHRALSRLLAVFRRRKLDEDFAEELSSHLDLLTEDNQRRGLSSEEARRQAILRLGGLNATKTLHRESRSLPRLEGFSHASWLDFKLGLRMLVKYPGLAFVGGLAMAVAIAIGTGISGVTEGFFYPTLPLDEGDRVIAIENWDVAANAAEPKSLSDFNTWRSELKSIEELGVYETVSRNLIVPGQTAEQITVAGMTASGFRVARVPALIGRHLLEEDERESSPQVIVIGYDVWQTDFGGSSAALGQTVRLGSTVHTIVGVMPKGFAYPVDHRFWIPFRANASQYGRRQGPAISVFGRLAPGATLESAQEELTALGLRSAAAFPETHGQLRPRVMLYAARWIDESELWQVRLLRFLIGLPLVVVCVNLAVLVYARTATRQSEIAVRSALGASRRRIVLQFFAEALVHATLSAIVGLIIARIALNQVRNFMPPQGSGEMPFWIDFSLSTTTILYVGGLVVVAAIIAGVIPALQATGLHLQSRLGQMGGIKGMRLGRMWTILIIAQVAIAVGSLPFLILGAGTLQWIEYSSSDPGFGAEEFLTARLGFDREIPPGIEASDYEREWASRYARLHTELARRLELESGVSDVTFALNIPGEERTVFIEVDGVTTPAYSEDYAVRSGTAGHLVRMGKVDVHLFNVFGASILAGRAFHSGDTGEAATAVIVNDAFVKEILHGEIPLGRRLRYTGRTGDANPSLVELGRSYEIVGVVTDFPKMMNPSYTQAKVYHALAPGQAQPVTLALRVSGARPTGFSQRLREITTSVDPVLRLSRVLSMDESLRQEQAMMRLAALGIGIVTLSVLLLSAAGIYALMSFTVTQRRREIGIRTALGADPRRILASIFGRALGELTIGVVVGILIAVALGVTEANPKLGSNRAIVLPAIAAIIITVGLLAAVGPARRSLRVSATEALRDS